jgi:hypothetical protein
MLHVFGSEVSELHVKKKKLVILTVSLDPLNFTLERVKYAELPLLKDDEN